MNIAILPLATPEATFALCEGVRAVYPDATLLPLYNDPEVLIGHMIREHCLNGILGAFISDAWIQGLPCPRSRPPMVNIVLDSAITSVPTVTIDNVAIGKRIANTFADTGFTSVTVLSTSANTAEQIQSEAFIAQAQARGLTCLPSPSNILEPLRAWIKTLPPKTGIFCTRDAFARRSINASRKTKLTVPQDLSIIGVGNTLTENFLSPISITTQPIPWRQIGEHAARALRQSPTAPHLLPPPPLLIRSSTAVCHADVALAKALTYIEHALADPPDINVLAHAAGLSRRALENRFSNFLNATPAGFWRERQRQKALTLLRTTSQSLDTIAAACGYASASHLSADFKRSNLQRPGSYRP